MVLIYKHRKTELYVSDEVAKVLRKFCSFVRLNNKISGLCKIRAAISTSEFDSVIYYSYNNTVGFTWICAILFEELEKRLEDQGL